MTSRKRIKLAARHTGVMDERSAALLSVIRRIWEEARTQAARSVNSALVRANWLIGKQIVEAEQEGKTRAGYGKQLLQTLSARLSAEYGSGFSLSAIKYMRLFYIEYPNLLPIRHAVRDELRTFKGAVGKGHAVRDDSVQVAAGPGWKPGGIHPALSWTHYRCLLKVDRREAREFYEIEAVRNAWSARQLERQINSLLFFRLLKSRDKKGLLALANRGQDVVEPVDALKDPYVLEFLGLPESHRLVESKLEEALISKLEDFLLELGSGFAFIGRQRRITLDGDHFYPDLIFYHTRLKCYVVIDLKVEKLSHADLGQMQLYIHYYDREVAAADDNPTLGLILCTDKNDALVRYVLDEGNRQIFTSTYRFQLPSEDELRNEIRREIRLLGSPAPDDRPPRKAR